MAALATLLICACAAQGSGRAVALRSILLPQRWTVLMVARRGGEKVEQVERHVTQCTMSMVEGGFGSVLGQCLDAAAVPAMNLTVSVDDEEERRSLVEITFRPWEAVADESEAWLSFTLPIDMQVLRSNAGLKSNGPVECQRDKEPQNCGSALILVTSSNSFSVVITPSPTGFPHLAKYLDFTVVATGDWAPRTVSTLDRWGPGVLLVVVFVIARIVLYFSSTRKPKVKTL
jgi:hypothetical protein